MQAEYKAVARQSLLFSSMPEEDAEMLLSTAHVSEYERGQTIFLQGETATAIFIVISGWAKLYRIAPSGTEAVVGVFTKGRSFGEAVAFQGDAYPVSAEAVTSLKLMRIETDAYLRRIRETPEAALSLLSSTFRHLHSLVAQIEALKARISAQRVAEFLCELSNAEEGACEVVLPYDKILIAGRLGMKPESLSRAFAKLKAEGVQIKQNRANIDDIEHLRTYSEEDPAQAWAR
ncbi:MAG: Crp/Fnr family transcriptional regulator [Shimia sp.]|uniref:Crp/Fnr family transcriptional regulator n=1 Tax=Shimia sp. TaxID=1954381 RepID=UPI0025FBEF31|nr:Crp/Fnr family transcriptional regulator [Shimia sp.]MCH2067030.1 Crp/Fnr family transcriptional regulator [Shimia sp.]